MTRRLRDDIACAPDEEALTLLWEHNTDTWTDEHTALVRARLAELGAWPDQYTSAQVAGFEAAGLTPADVAEMRSRQRERK